MLSDIVNRSKYGEIECSIKDKKNYKRFLSAKEAEEWGFSYYSAWAENYNNVTKLCKSILGAESSTFFSPIQFYCGEHFRQINHYLRFKSDDTVSGSAVNDDTTNTNRELAHILTLLLCDAPKIPDDIVVYRFVCKDFMEHLVIENKKRLPVQEKGFMSTSILNMASFSDFTPMSQNLLEIYVPKGTVGLYVNPICPRDEYELLLAPGRFLQMVSYPCEKSNGLSVTECKLINMECIPK